ncbi:MAG: SUMF1/EgtB/PvdO family nonheme iron enzyme [Bacteroidales bacterium]|nr:SUMF1/EgtB/PvdO family nonheme iron enzyme [Bacteroidales bacterium]
MKTKRIFQLVFAFSAVVILLASCKSKEVSNTTGWAYNNPKNGGFEKASFRGQITGPGLVFIEGGRFTMGRVEEDVMKDWDNYPRTVTVSSFYMDEGEITNFDYLEYLYWLDRVYVPVDLQSVYYAALPDTACWRHKLAYNEPYVENYLRYPAYRDYPVVGVSWVQATKYCAWRTDRVNEQILIDEGLINMTNEPTAEGHFNTEAYLLYPDYEQNSDRRLQYILTGEERNAKLEDGILLPKYRLPTEAEWEFAALGLIGNTLNERILDRRTYPWNGQVTRTDDKKYMGDYVMNVRRGRGDYMGVASALNDDANYTSSTYAYWPNDYGLYSMGGNVAEWVMDVYRPVNHDDVAELDPFRGNVYETYKLLDDGTIEDRDEEGNVPKVPVSDFKNDRRRNYRSANNINYLDGDWASNLDLDGESWTRKNNTNSTVNMYDKQNYPQGNYSLVSDNSRVVKGGSWADIHYFASPGNRRFLDQNEATCYIGFRCAMTRLGSQSAR